MWHASVSFTHTATRQRLTRPTAAEQVAVTLLEGVGGEREWWYWNLGAVVGHLRVSLTPGEVLRIPPGIAEHDAGVTGPERPRTRKAPTP